ncbi:MAG: acyl-[acyl-carrier-protein] thioesterase [Dorea sp.]|jgi:medium-chain acyl-[acyl-carrier-protein] hydrolase|nr:acyl-[acyl-carrier-protein] thioesterase [Dorea sp.]
MQKSNKYTIDGRIRFSEVDHTNRITLPGIINYFQDCSTFHSESLGVGPDYCKERERVWILSSWQVVAERYPSMGEHIKVSTWATKFEGLYGLRNFCMEDESGRMNAYANSMWVYMDTRKGRPVRPDAYEVELYGSGEPLKMDYASRKIALPKDLRICNEYPVRRYHIDTNEHVNNCQYVQMAMEELGGTEDIRQLRVEYKKSAVYGDIIYPKAAFEEDRTVVELCDEEGKIYAVVEFKVKNE